jgi:hypothetical protein
MQVPQPTQIAVHSILAIAISTLLDRHQHMRLIDAAVLCISSSSCSSNKFISCHGIYDLY